MRTAERPRGDAASERSTIGNQHSTILWLLIPSLALIIILLFDLVPALRGNDEWRWPLRPFEWTARILIPMVLLGLYVLGCAWWLKGFERESVPRRYERWLLLFVTIATPIIQLALACAISRVPLLEFFGPTVSVHNSGYFTTAVTTPDLNQLLANFPAAMPQLPIHAQSHPPGAILLHGLSWQAFQALPSVAESVALPLRTLQCHNPGLMALDNAQIAAATIGMLLPLIGALAVWPLYAVAKRVATPIAAAITVMAFPLLPLFAMWPAQWDQLYPLLLFVGLYLAHTGLEKKSLWRVFLAGVPLSLATFFSVGNFVLMVIVGLYGAAWLWFQRPIAVSPRRATSQSLVLLIVYLLGCLLIWLAYWLFYGVNPLAVISTGSRLAFESTTGNRSYGVWLLGNPLDFAVFLGFPIVILLLANLIKRLPFPKSLLPITVATFGTLLLLWLSGIVRGEVGRLWLYLGPLVVLIAVGWREGQRAGDREQGAQGEEHAPRTPRHRAVSRRSFYAIFLALLAAQLLIMNTRWLVNDSFLDEPPERSVDMSPPPLTYLASASFADQIALRGYDVRFGDHVLDLTLYWQALAQPPHAYTVFVHVLDRAGNQIGQQDNMPVRDRLATSCWQPGEYVGDPYTIQLPARAGGPFTIEVGLYRGDTGVRLMRSDAQGDRVVLEAP